MSGKIIAQKVIFWGLGGFLFVVGMIMCVAWPIYFFNQLENKLKLTNSSQSYSLWKNTPIPMYFEVHMFNWTNPEETIKNGAVPNFVEVGPYVFSENHEKVNITWNKNGTVTFRQVRQWKFIPELSKGSLSDKITNINVIALTVGNAIKEHCPKYLLPIANKVLDHEEKSIYVTKTVDEFLFKGFDDPFLTLATKLQPILKYKVPFDKFGWFYKRNNSIEFDGVFNMKTGSDSLSTLGLIDNWNYKTKTNSYSGRCSVVNGTTGELWPYDAARQNEINIFATDICSSITLTATNSSSLVQGINGNVFIGDKMVFDNGQKSKENACYCSGNKFPCPPSGSRDISTCRFGAPAFISYPHFYLADDSYKKKVSGMNASREEHQFFLILDKVTSIPLEVHARLQINIYCSSIPNINFFNGLPTAYFPAMWFDQRARMTPELASQIIQLDFLNSYLEPIFIGLAGLGFILVVVGLFLWARRVRAKYGSSSPLIEDTPSTSSVN